MARSAPPDLLRRIVATFVVAGLAVSIVAGVFLIDRPTAGDLPIEISGRGLRYADASVAQQGALDSEGAFERVEREVEALREAVSVIELRQHDRAGTAHDDKDDML